MLNWRRIRNAAFTATLASSALASATAWADTTKNFNFPVVLCRFKQAVLKDSGGTLKVVADREWGPEYAFPVGNVHTQGARLDGDFAGTYEIPASPYRLRLEGSIEQALDLSVDHQLSLHAVLEKKLDKPDSSGKLWQEVGQSSRTVAAKAQADGSVWENIYPYTYNTAEMQRYIAGGKLKQDLVIAGIRDGFLDKGSVFKVGPACGFLDARTAKSVVSAENKQKFRSIFDRITDAPSSTQLAEAAEVKKPIKFELPQHNTQIPQATPDSQVAQQEAHQEEKDPRDLPEQPEQPQQGITQSQVAARQAQQQEMSPELQAQLAQQNQLADQAAAAYNFQQQQAQNGTAAAPVDGRDPASSNTAQIGQVAQNLQSLQNPEQVQQNLNVLEQQRQALAQQQNAIDQQQQFLMQKQQDLASAADANNNANADANTNTNTQAQPQSQAAPVGQGF